MKTIISWHYRFQHLVIDKHKYSSSITNKSSVLDRAFVSVLHTAGILQRQQRCILL